MYKHSSFRVSEFRQLLPLCYDGLGWNRRSVPSLQILDWFYMTVIVESSSKQQVFAESGLAFLN